MELTQLKKDLRRGANASGILLILFYILVYGGTRLLFMIMEQNFTGSEAARDDLYGILAYTLQYPVVVPLVLGVFWLICGKHTGQRLRDCFCKPKVSKATMARWIFICLGLTYASAYISRIFFLLIQWILGIELAAQDFAAGESVLSMLTNILAMVIYAPLFEEMLFRGTIFRSMQKGGELGGAILCGLLFGLWHTNYDQLIYTAAAGFFMCILAAKTGTILAPILMHVLMNTIGAFQSLFMGDFNPNDMLAMETDAQMMTYLAENAGSFLAIMLSGMLVMGLTGAGIILLIIEQKQFKQLFNFNSDTAVLPLKEKLKLCLTTPGMILCCLVLLVLTVLRAMGIL